MNTDKQRIAIAEACGMIRYSPTHWLTSEDDGEVIPLPDYLADLNAMHEAEKVLSDDQHATFRRLLASIAGERESPAYSSPGWRRRYCTATAAHRAEAFLRTLGKWEEETTK